MTPHATCCPVPVIATVARHGTKMAGYRVPGHGHFSCPIWIAAIYEARPRQRDGVWTWRRVRHPAINEGTRAGRVPSDRFEGVVRAAANAAGLPYVPRGRAPRHGQPCGAER